MPGFIMVMKFVRELDWLPLKTIITNTKETVLLLLSLVFGAGSISYTKTFIGLHFIDIKIVSFSSIFYRSTY